MPDFPVTLAMFKAQEVELETLRGRVSILEKLLSDVPKQMEELRSKVGNPAPPPPNPPGPKEKEKRYGRFGR